MTERDASSDALVGRQAELDAIVTLVEEGRGVLVLLTGAPRMGKGRLLLGLRERLEGGGSTVLPEALFANERGWLVIDRQTTPESFGYDVSSGAGHPSSAGGVELDGLAVQAPTVVLIYGYRPDEVFHDWFRHDFLPRLPRATPPQVVVLAGYLSEFEDLVPLAERVLTLGPLPVDAVDEHLRVLDATLREPMGEDEIRAYAQAAAEAPGFLEALQSLLRYETGPRRGQP